MASSQAAIGVLVFEGFGSAEGAAWVADQARTLTGRVPTDVIVSHQHGDHHGGLGGFAADSGRPMVWATAATRDLVLSRNSHEAPEMLETASLLAPDGPTIIDLGGRSIAVTPYSGHTASDIIATVDDTTSCGDLLWIDMVPNFVHATPIEIGRSVDTMLVAGTTTMVPGHGPIPDAGALGEYRMLLEVIETEGRRSFAAGQTPAEAAAVSAAGRAQEVERVRLTRTGRDRDRLPERLRGVAPTARSWKPRGTRAARGGTNEMQDLILAYRFLVKRPGWTIAAVLTLAIGISGSTLAASLIDHVVWRPLDFRSGDELITLYARSAGEYSPLPYQDYVDFRDALDEGGHADLAAFVRTFATVGGGAYPEEHQLELVTGNFFAVLRVRPHIGRLLTESDNTAPGAHRVVVLSHVIWETLFGADPGIVGTVVSLDGRSYEVVGVAEPGFRGPVWPTFRSALWIPAMMAPDFWGEAPVLTGRRMGTFQTVGRLRDGRSAAAAQVRIDPLDEVLSRDRVNNPFFVDTGMSWRVAVLPGTYLRIWPEYRATVMRLSTMLGALAVVALLVACANLATLLLARSVERDHELAIRRALGAATRDIVRRVGAEALLLSATGGALAVGLSFAISGLSARLPVGLPLGIAYRVELAPDHRMFAIGTVVAAMALLAVVTIPVVHAVRDRRSLVASRRSVGVGGLRAMHALVVVQVALCVALLVVCGLLARSARNTLAIDPGFRADRGVVARVVAPRDRDPASLGQFYQTLVDRLSSERVVASASASNSHVLSNASAMGLYLPDSPVVEVEQLVGGRMLRVSGEYFDTFEIPLVAGRSFSRAEESTGAVAVVSRTLADRYWPGTGPIGRALRLESEDEPRRIVGIVGDTAGRDIREASLPLVYVPYAQDVSVWTQVALRLRTDEATGVTLLRDHVRVLDPSLAVAGPRTFAELRAAATDDARVQAGLAGVLAAAGAGLALVGLYGLMGYVVGRREREFGIRAALGATPVTLAGLVVRHAGRLAFSGIACGLAASLVAGRGLAGVLYRVDATDPLTFAVAAVALGGAMMSACVAPARRAACVDPVDALRSE